MGSTIVSNLTPVATSPGAISQPTSPLSPNLSTTFVASESINDSNRVVPNSDDEDDDSSVCSLEDLASAAIWKTAPPSRPLPTTSASTMNAPSTPRTSRSRKPSKPAFKLSPLTVRTQSKFKFDLKSLVSAAADGEALEESTRRVKAMLEVPEDTEMTGDGRVGLSDAHGEILQKISADKDKEEGSGAHDAQKVMNALKRTEATHTDNRWRFFAAEENCSLSKGTPFPKAALPKEWKNDLTEPQVRHQTFVSGFAENMITYGKHLPDEVILWILDEVCVAELDDLRHAYISILDVSSEQVRRLLTSEVIKNMFRRLGATSTAIGLTEKIRPRPEISDPYTHHHWSKVISFIGFIGQIAKYLDQETRLLTICLLLRMGIDRVLLERADWLTLVQSALDNLCRYIQQDAWEASCREICTSILNSVETAPLQLQAVQCMSSTSTRVHELRRRLAMAFYFKDLSKALQPPSTLIQIPQVTKRLEDPEFAIKADTDYQQLECLILLLDIAVDDGRRTDLNLEDKAVELQFNSEVDALANAISNIRIPHSGASFMSRIEASQATALVSKRIQSTVRSKPSPKHNIYDEASHGVGRKEIFAPEQKGMASFLEKLRQKKALEVKT